MGCKKSLTFSQSVTAEDMPLDRARYIVSPLGGTHIYACRGQYMFTIDPTTGAKQSSAIIPSLTHPRLLPTTTFAYNPANDRLYFGGWSQTWTGVSSNDYAGIWGDFKGHAEVYVVNPLTLAVESIMDMSAILFELSLVDNKVIGFRDLEWFSDSLVGIEQVNERMLPFRWRSVGPQWVKLESIQAEFGLGVNGICYDPVNNFVWTVQTFYQVVFVASLADATAFGWFYLDLEDTWTDMGAHSLLGFSIEYCATVPNAAFMGCQNGIVAHLVWTGAAIAYSASINTTQAGEIYRLRYNSYNGKLYAVCYETNSVAVISPTTDTLDSVKTGFDGPWDMVFTPTKVWVVQQGNVGLKELT